MSDEPDYDGGNEYFVYMSLASGKWNVWEDEYNMNFICESTLTDE
jgi:hypothetical protein